MSKKQINNRLDKLFDDIKEEEKAIEKPTRAKIKRSRKTKKTLKRDTMPPVSKSQQKEIVETLEVQVDTTDTYATMSLPLRMDANTWGTLQIVDANAQREWDTEEQLLAQQVTEQLALALDNARLFQQTAARTEELTLINKIVEKVSQTLDLNKGLQIIAEELASAVSAHHVGIALLTEDETEVTLVADAPLHKADIGLSIPVIGTTADVIQKQVPLIVDDIRTDPRTAGIKDILLARGTLGLAVFPLRSGQEIIGTVGIDFSQPDRNLNIDETRLIETILVQASTSIETARLFEESQLSEERARVIVQNAPEAIVMIDMDTGLFIEPNDNALLLYGLSKEEILKVSPADLSPPTQPDGRSSTEAVLEQIKIALDGGAPVFDWTHLHANGDEIFCEIRLVQLPDAAKTLIRASVIDISERKQAEIQIQRLSNAVEQSLDGMAIANMDGSIEFVNPAWATMHGYATTEELIGKPLTTFHSEEQLESDINAFNDIVKTKGSHQGEVGHKRKDGSQFPAWLTIGILKSVDNIPMALVASAQDITERKKDEQTLRRQNEYMEAAAEVGRLVTSTLDTGILFRRAVNLLQEHFGYYHAAIFTAEEAGFDVIVREATGEAGKEMKEGEHAIKIGSKSVVGTATETGEPYIVNDVTKNPNYIPHPLLTETKAEAAIPLKIGRRIIGALDLQATEVDAFTPEDVAVLQLLTDQFATAIDNARSYKLSQDAFLEMRELEKLKSQFLANMSHELRTPLNSIIGFSRVILKGIDGPVTDLQQQDLTAIYNSGQHLLGLINDILDLSKIEAGKMELTLDEVDIEKLITSVMSTVMGLVKDKPVRLEKEIETDLPPVKADSMRVRQILINLFSNAAKFTDEGTITVVAKRISTGVRIGVLDSGPGISEEDQAKLFQAFSQVDASATRATGGSGLGLSISKQLVTMHGGEIGLNSEVGKGSEFYFTLLFYDEQENTVEDAEHQPDGSPVILAIDDDEKVISLYQRYLSAQGYQIVALTDPKKAVERAKEIKPYAITLDIMMPGYDGWQVLEDLKSDPETQKYPTIICSIIEDTEKGYSLGATDYLLKPILDDDLLGALHRLNDAGEIYDILLIDNDPDDLRLLEKLLIESKTYKPTLANSGPAGWDMIVNHPPQAVILDLFMPEMNGFEIMEAMQASPDLREIPVIVISGGDLNTNQQEKLDSLNLHLLQKGNLDSKDLLTTLERSLNHLKKTGKKGNK